MLFIFLGLITTLASAETRILNYNENGAWIVKLSRIDSEGFPDTIEKRAFPNEALAKTFSSTFLNHSAFAPRGMGLQEVPKELRNALYGEIWNATESWSLEWESRYSEWIRKNFDSRFFSRYKIKTDCADAAYAVRWIFSRMNHLPAGNRLDVGEVLLTNRSVRSSWKDLPTAENWYEDPRFLTALDYLLDHTFTHSLQEDSYPIEINSNWLYEGAYHIELRENDGHTRIFTKVTHDGSSWPIEDMYSNVPRTIRTLIVEPFTVYAQPLRKLGGVLRTRWLILDDDSAFLVPIEKMPGYSLEQYQSDFFKHGKFDFALEVSSRINNSIDPLSGFISVLNNLNKSLFDRKHVVKKGFKNCKKINCTPGTPGYENWGTPARDSRIGEYFEQINSALSGFKGEELERAVVMMEKEKKLRFLKLKKKRLYFEELEEIWARHLYSSNPQDPPEKRWGL